MAQSLPEHDLGHLVLIALGSNLSDSILVSAAFVQDALNALEEVFDFSMHSSRIFRTPAFPVGSGPDFANAVCALRLQHSPTSLLEILHRIEAKAGRDRSKRWGQRSLDLDLLAVGDVVAPDLHVWQHWHDLPLDAQMKVAPEELILPHPRLQDRAFVLVPLLDVAPDWRHPVTQATVRTMCAACPAADIAAVQPLDIDQNRLVNPGATS